MRLDQPPRLMQPTVAVRDSWLVGERAYCVSANGRTACRRTGVLRAGRRLDGTARSRDRGLRASRCRTARVRTWWGVPTTFFWYISGARYLGELVIRHKLIPALAESGLHIGYDVAPPWRRHQSVPDHQRRARKRIWPGWICPG